MKLKDLWGLIKSTFTEWSEDKASRLAAALAYYTAFSIAPILVIALAIVGFFWSRAEAQNMIINQIGQLAGPSGQEMILNMLTATQDIGANLWAAVIGVVALIFAATGVFGQLQEALNTIWEVQPKKSRGIWGVIKDRFLSFTMVIGVGFLLLVSLVISALLSVVSNLTLNLFPGFEFVMRIVNLIVSLLVITVMFSLVFKFIPDAKIRWRDVWLGAAVTAVLFNLGLFLIGIYLGNSNIGDTFGAAGAFVILLVWVYYSAQILFFGAEFTQVYANTYGEKIVPDIGASALSEEARAKQGMTRKEVPEGKRVESPSGVVQGERDIPLLEAGPQPQAGANPPPPRLPQPIFRSAATILSIFGSMVIGTFLGFMVNKKK